jgi:hypothetical protein
MVNKAIRLQSYSLKLIKEAIVKEVDVPVAFNPIGNGNVQIIGTEIFDDPVQGELELPFPIGEILEVEDVDGQNFYVWDYMIELDDDESRCMEADHAMLRNADMGNEVMASQMRRFQPKRGFEENDPFEGMIE